MKAIEITKPFEIKVIEKEKELILAEGDRGYALKRNLFTEELVRLMTDTGNGVALSDVITELALEEEAERELQKLLEVLCQKGIIIII